MANLHAASPNQLSLLRCSIQKGFMEVQDQRIDLRHSIFIMSGAFSLPAQNSLRFAEMQSYQGLLDKQLGRDFMDKLNILRRATQNWRHAPDELTLVNVCRQSDTIANAMKQLRCGMMHTI